MSMLEMLAIPGMDGGRLTLGKMYADSKKRMKENIVAQRKAAAAMSANRKAAK